MTVPYPEIGLAKSSLTGLDVSARIYTANGWMEIHSPKGYPYELGRNTFGSSQRTQRRTQVSNPFVPGTFTVNSVPENITETCEVWVTGDTHYEMEAHKDVLVAAFEQVSYLMEIRVEDSVKTWYCYAADTQINSQAEYLHSRLVLVTAQIMRRPEEQRSLA